MFLFYLFLYTNLDYFVNFFRFTIEFYLITTYHVFRRENVSGYIFCNLNFKRGLYL
jgi:hypothetical protein